MSHLSSAEFVDAAEGVLPPARTAHLQSCAACRDRIDEVTAALHAAAGVDVPEPSPLYWAHMAARIREQVAGETPREESWWQVPAVRRLVPFASAAAIVAAVVVTGIMSRGRHASAPLESAPVVAVVPADPAVQPDDSEAWQMLTSAADETPIEDVHAAGMGVSAGAVDRAVLRMTPEEVNALGQLLQKELRRSGA